MNKSTFDNSVFINCPFDKSKIDSILKPILFCLIFHRLYPQLALDINDSGQLRIDKIVKLMKNSKFSIHDLSLLKVPKVSEFARMNMPYELGIDYGLRLSGVTGVNRYEEKRFLILGSKRYDYMKAISDLNGFDIQNHENKTRKVFDCMHLWLSTIGLDSEVLPSLKMYYEFMDFNAYTYFTISQKFGEEVVKDHLEKMSIPEYKKHIETYLSHKKSKS